MTTTTATPTVVLLITSGGSTSAIAYEEGGEIIETVDFNDDGTPDWTSGGICDARGGGGQEGFTALAVSLAEAEKNARLLGIDIVRLPEGRLAE